MGKIDWQRLHSGPLEHAARQLTVRGKNLAFISRLLNAMGFNPLDSELEFSNLKDRITPQCVYDIHSAIQEIWPDLNDYERALDQDHESLTAFYTGSYEPKDIRSSVTRLSLYTDRILLIDPFYNSHRFGPELSPFVRPELHRSNTIRYVELWLTFWPWIESGLISFIRPLPDFVPGLNEEIITYNRTWRSLHPELNDINRQEVDAMMKHRTPVDRDLGEWFFLSQSDEFLWKSFQESIDDSPFKNKETFLAYVNKRRESHPFFVSDRYERYGQIHHETSGACYELAKRMCALTNSHMVTNMKVRWKEIELDRAAAGIDSSRWSPFAKALQNSQLRSLDQVDLDAALRLRKEDRLESMRLFLRGVWKSARVSDHFSDDNAIEFASQLSGQIALANEEWDKIDRDLYKWLAGPAAGMFVSTFSANIVPAAVAIGAGTGIAGLYESHTKRKSFRTRYPSGFFLGR